MSAPPQPIAVIGGTGAEGRGLALRWAAAGLDVIIGSRDGAKAEGAAEAINDRAGTASARGMANSDAARAAALVVLAVPYAAQTETALALGDGLDGKILVDVTVPLKPPKVARVQLPEGGSAALALQARLGARVRVVSAFQNVSAHHLEALGQPVPCDVLVAGDDPADRAVVIALAEAIGLAAYHAGPLANAAAAEALTSVLISINKRYKSPGAGIRITGIPDPAS